MQRITRHRAVVPPSPQIRDFALLWKRASRSRLTPVAQRAISRGTLRRDHQVRWTRGRRSASWRG